MKSYKQMQASHYEMDKELYAAISEPETVTVDEVLDYMEAHGSLSVTDGVLSLEIRRA